MNARDAKALVKTWHHEVGNGIRGTRIVLMARDIAKVRVESNSGRHQAQVTHGSNNAEAWLEIPLRAIAEKK